MKYQIIKGSGDEKEIIAEYDQCPGINKGDGVTIPGIPYPVIIHAVIHLTEKQVTMYCYFPGL